MLCIAYSRPVTSQYKDGDWGSRLPPKAGWSTFQNSCWQSSLLCLWHVGHINKSLEKFYPSNGPSAMARLLVPWLSGHTLDSHLHHHWLWDITTLTHQRKGSRKKLGVETPARSNTRVDNTSLWASACARGHQLIATGLQMCQLEGVLNQPCCHIVHLASLTLCCITAQVLRQMHLRWTGSKEPILYWKTWHHHQPCSVGKMTPGKGAVQWRMDELLIDIDMH